MTDSNATGQGPTPSSPRTDIIRMEQIKVSGDKLKDVLKKLIHEGTVRRIVIRNKDGKSLVDMPIAAGVAGIALAPFWVAVTGVVALAKEFTIEYERHGA